MINMWMRTCITCHQMPRQAYLWNWGNLSDRPCRVCATCRTARRNNKAAFSRQCVRGRRLPLCPSSHINIYLNFTLQSFFIRDQRVMGIKCKCSSWPTVYNNSTPNLENWVKAIRECDEASVFTAFLQVWVTWKKTRQEVTSEEPLSPQDNGMFRPLSKCARVYNKPPNTISWNWWIKVWGEVCWC